MLEIGINEGYNFGPGPKLEKTNYGLVLDLNFVKGKAVTSAMELISMDDPEPENNFTRMFAPKPTYIDKKDKDKVKKRTHLEVASDIRVMYRTVWCIYNLYFTQAELADLFPASLPYADTGMTLENEKTMFIQQPIIDKMVTNIFNAVHAFNIKYNIHEREAFRFKMLRRNDDKAYPTLPNKPEWGGWIELISVPLDKTEVKFTDWEINNNKANAIPVARDVTPKSGSNDFDEGAIAITEDAIPEGETEKEVTDNKDDLPFS